MAVQQYVVFNINNEEFGINIDQVNIIEKPLEIFKIPNTPEFIEGLVNLRGKVHTVFNLRKRFNLPAKEFDESTKIIMANYGSNITGLIVDEVKEIIKVDDKDIESTANVMTEFKNKYISGVAKVENRVILLLNLDIVLSIE